MIWHLQDGNQQALDFHAPRCMICSSTTCAWEKCQAWSCWSFWAAELQIRSKRLNWPGLPPTTALTMNGERAGPASLICSRSSLQSRWTRLTLLLSFQSYSRGTTAWQAAWTTCTRRNPLKELLLISLSTWLTIRVLAERTGPDFVPASWMILRMVTILLSVSGQPKTSIFQMIPWTISHSSWLPQDAGLPPSDHSGSRRSLSTTSSWGFGVFKNGERAQGVRPG